MPDHVPQTAEYRTRVPVLLITQVREILQDYRNINELFEGEELSDEQIGRFIVDTIDDWNYTPPILNPLITPTSVLTNRAEGAIRVAIVKGSAIRGKKLLIYRHAKNDMPFTGGNITVQAHGIWANLFKLLELEQAEFQNTKTQIKVALNIRGAYTMAPSELDSYYGLGFNDGAFILI